MDLSSRSLNLSADAMAGKRPAAVAERVVRATLVEPPRQVFGLLSRVFETTNAAVPLDHAPMLERTSAFVGRTFRHA
jgi:hypothetical protein